MAQRVLKIILPAKDKNDALKLLESEKDTIHWQEESSIENFVVSVLTEAEHSESLMDIFDRRYSSIPGFKLVVFPVEASIPRTDSTETSKEVDNTESKADKKSRALRISREELYADIVDSTKLSSTFVLMTVLSTLVVSIGLQHNNVAVIIGAMVIAPFLGPNVALALSACLADRELSKNALKTLLSGTAITVILAVVLGYFFNTSAEAHEIQARTHVNISDFLLALASGSAGVLAFTTGASSAVIGVMVAVALLPPLTVFGLLLGAGSYSEAFGALLLFCTNIICVNLAGVATFLSQGVSPRTWWEADKAKKATRRSLLLWSFSTLLLIVILIILKYR